MSASSDGRGETLRVAGCAVTGVADVPAKGTVGVGLASPYGLEALELSTVFRVRLLPKVDGNAVDWLARVDIDE
jgi:hypothetical protein